ncbi:hypothetical protein [Prevotella sp. oral taxon 299]|uniref:hypothetical protein n=1 Tax=Prevotella sp. oral taxon 299 TaxID=652716 RepID=UPI0001C3F806|nr:hypothetical protein [Prevotella sp. oral taxon 299]
MNRVSTKDKGRPVDKKQKYNMNSREFFSKVALMDLQHDMGKRQGHPFCTSIECSLLLVSTAIIITIILGLIMSGFNRD